MQSAKCIISTTLGKLRYLAQKRWLYGDVLLDLANRYDTIIIAITRYGRLIRASELPLNRSNPLSDLDERWLSSYYSLPRTP